MALNLKRNYFSQLGSIAASVLRSFVLHAVADTFVYLFINAFLWRTTSSVNLIAIYNLLWFAGFPIGFYVTGYLLRRFLTTQLYFVACVMQGFILSSLIFFPHPSFLFIMIYGTFFGTATGIYYANGHFVTLKLTNTANRIYFSSLNQAFGTVIGLVLPPLAGFFIVFGIAHDLPSYPILFFIAAIFLVLSGLALVRVPVEQTSIPRITLAYASHGWSIFRLFMAIQGLVGGVGVFLPTLLALTFLGEEDKLGIIRACISLLSTLLLYIIAKKVKVQHRLFLFSVSFGMLLLGAIILGLIYSSIGVSCFIVFQALAGQLVWIGINSLTYDLIDHEVSQNGNSHYSYLCDREFYLNLGRVIAIAIFVGVVTLLSAELAIRFSMLVLACTQLLMLLLVRKTDRLHEASSKLLGEQ